MTSSYNGEHDDVVAVIRRELIDLVSDDSDLRASAVATIRQAAHEASLVMPYPGPPPRCTHSNGVLIERYRDVHDG